MSSKDDREFEENLEKLLGPKFKKAEVEANKAADRESSPAGKAKAYAKVMKKHRIDVDVRGLTKKFKGLMNE